MSKSVSPLGPVALGVIYGFRVDRHVIQILTCNIQYIYHPTCNIDSDKVEVLITSWNGFVKAEHDMAIFFDLDQIMKKVTTIPPIAGKKTLTITSNFNLLNTHTHTTKITMYDLKWNNQIKQKQIKNKNVDIQLSADDAFLDSE